MQNLHLAFSTNFREDVKGFADHVQSLILSSANSLEELLGYADFVRSLVIVSSTILEYSCTDMLLQNQVCFSNLVLILEKIYADMLILYKVYLLHFLLFV